MKFAPDALICEAGGGIDLEKEQAVKKLPYWQHLSEEEKKFVEQNVVVRNFLKGEIVHGYGSSCLGTALVLAGELRVYILSEDGREITLFRMGEGASCVLSASCIIRQITFETNMVAESDCSLLVLGSAAFDRLSEKNIYVKCFLYEVAAERFSSVMWTMQQILFLKMDKRLANFLIAECEESGSKIIKMTHEQIAVRISSAREVVARMLKRFEADGLVSLGRGCVIIKDLQSLKKI